MLGMRQKGHLVCSVGKEESSSSALADFNPIQLHEASIHQDGVLSNGLR